MFDWTHWDWKLKILNINADLRGLISVRGEIFTNLFLDNVEAPPTISKKSKKITGISFSKKRLLCFSSVPKDKKKCRVFYYSAPELTYDITNKFNFTIETMLV